MPWSVRQVPEAAIDDVWPEIAPLCQRAIKRVGEDVLTVEEIETKLRDGSYLLWVVLEGDVIVAALVLSIIERQGNPVLFIVMVVGRDFQAWAPEVQEMLQHFMAAIGARKIESVSRIGMEKWMRALGWRKRAVIMEWTDGRY